MAQDRDAAVRRTTSSSTTTTSRTRYQVERKRRLWPLLLLAGVPIAAAIVEKDDTGLAVTGDSTPPVESAAPTQPPASEAPVVTDPPTTQPAATEPASSAPAALDIVDTAVGNGSFTVLTDLVTTAGLVDTLKGTGPFTVFAPTDAAFGKLPADQVAALKADKDLLTKVLTYHVVPGKVMAAEVKTGEADTVNGEQLNLTADGGKVTVQANDSDVATVTQADITASNGVIHVIDTVLIPPSMRAPAAATTALNVKGAFDGGKIVLTGVVDNDAQKKAIYDGAVAAQGGDATKVDDQMTVANTAGDVADSDDRAGRLGKLLATLPPNFALGDAAVSPTKLTLSGNYIDDAAKARAEADAAAVGVDPADIAIEPRPQATGADRDALIAKINALFIDKTIQFAPSKADILPVSNSLLDDAATQLKQFDLTGIKINIEGHTDGDGSAASNQALSQRRAEAVKAALVARGISAAALTPIGFGESRPVAPNDTPANKAKNRRVQFSAAQ